MDGARGPATAPGPAAGEPLDLVWISDSSGWGAAPFYARHIRKDLGVAVRVQDRWEGGLSAAAILSRLRSRGHEWLPLIRNAEVIFVTGNPIGLHPVKGGDCVSISKPPLVIGPGTWKKYVAGLKAIYRRIFEIRKGKPVILRTGNWYVPAISQAERADVSARELGRGRNHRSVHEGVRVVRLGHLQGRSHLPRTR